MARAETTVSVNRGDARSVEGRTLDELKKKGQSNRFSVCVPDGSDEAWPRGGDDSRVRQRDYERGVHQAMMLTCNVEKQKRSWGVSLLTSVRHASVECKES